MWCDGAANVKLFMGDHFIIRGGYPLRGEIVIGGAKNSALKLLAAGLLTSEQLVLSNVPRIDDITTMIALLRYLGFNVADVSGDGSVLSVGGEITNTEAPYDIVSKMRASVLVLGPLLARYHKARVSLPGGCAIGTRPITLHLKGLEALGGNITLENGYICASTTRRLKGGNVVFPLVSVGATENVMMAATLAEGRTTIVNAACEPEIVDLANCLNKMGAKISGAGEKTIIIDGVEALHGTHHQIMSDRIECGTYACAAAITRGDLRLINGNIDHLGAVVRTLRECGIDVSQTDNVMHVQCQKTLRSTKIVTEPYPGFPTDMQAQFMALLSVVEGTSEITETVFENRFMHVPELIRLGAHIDVQGSLATVHGVRHLTGAPVRATDLRASFSLILAGLVARGETVLDNVYHLDRGYEAVERKLSACGAKIERVQKNKI